MTATSDFTTGFTHADLLACLPFLRPMARALTKHRGSAEDLVQDTVVRALSAAHQFRTGTNLKAWMFTILRHTHFNEMRKAYLRSDPFDESNEPTVPASQDSALEFSDFVSALGKIQPDRRDPLLLVGVNGLSYDQVAKIYDCPVGTIKSRVGRARDQLHWLCEGGSLDDKEGLATRGNLTTKKLRGKRASSRAQGASLRNRSGAPTPSSIAA